MNALPSLSLWLSPLGWLALEAAVVVLAALAVQPFLRDAAARRSLWRAVLVALALLLAAELTGAGSQFPAQLRIAWANAFPAPIPPPTPPLSLAESPFTPPPPFPLAPIGGEGRGEGAAPNEVVAFESPSAPPLAPAHFPARPPAPPAWPAFLWLAGLAALLARSAWTHAGFAWLRLRHFIPAAEALRQRVQALAARLGLRRRVRVLASERLRAPAAFGWLRPGVSVPGDFTARFAPAQQDVMLAHELAHLAARDPLWQLLADLVAAALWWHPLAWVARRQHRLAGELAADDASQALPDGPVVLAECLLALGHEAAACPRAALGMAGFRSQLGRRVERLVALPHRDWQAPSRLRFALQTTTALLALAALALLPGCAANRTAGEAPSSLVAKWWQAKQSPVGDDVRSLSKNAERGMRNAESSQSLVTLAATNAQPVVVQGRVSFNGTPPPERDIPLPPSVLTARSNAPVMTRFHRVSPDGGLADVLVYVKAGLTNQTFAAPTNTFVVRADRYEFEPYIGATRAGQTVRWESHLTTGLSIHPTPTNHANREFNFTLMAHKSLDARFNGPELFLRVKTDVYPWMFHYISILPHPFFAVTDDEGRFRFPQPLPPGKYTLAAVHRQAGESVQELDLTQPLPAGQPPEVQFVLSTKAFAPYVVAVGDEVRMEVYQRDNLRTQAKVQPDGTLTLPLIGAVKAAGNNISELRNVIRDAYEAAHFRPAHVNVVLIQPSRPTGSNRAAPALGQALDFTPSTPPTRAELLERKTRVEAELKEAEQSLSPTHPKSKGLRRQLESVEEALNENAKTTRELELCRTRLLQLERVGMRLQNTNLLISERLALYAALSDMLTDSKSMLWTSSWEGLEGQKLALERTLKQVPQSDLQKQSLYKQVKALEQQLEDELKKAAARFEILKQNLIKRKEHLSKLTGEAGTKPPAPPKPSASLQPAPVGDDVRSLTSPQTPDAKPQTQSQSQRLLTSSPTMEDEALRRQERKVALDKLLGEAGQFQKIKSWTNAVVRYEEGLLLAPPLNGRFGAPQQVTDAIAGLNYCRLQLAIEHKQRSQFAQATELADKVLALDAANDFARLIKQLVERVSKPTPSGAAVSVDAADQAKAERLIASTRLRLDQNNTRDAFQNLWAALLTNPRSDADSSLLLLLLDKRFEDERVRLAATQWGRVVAVTQKWNEEARSKNGLPVPNPYAKTNSEVPFLTHSSKGAQGINRKLDQIVLPEVHFDGVTLAEVLKRLDADAKQFDPEKKGLNFLINDVAPLAPLLDANGNPVPVARPVALSEGLVRVSQPLKNLTLRQALDVICKTAELPTQFSVEEYAIVFIPRGPVAYYSRMFRVNPDAFIQGLQGVVGNPVPGVTPGGGNQPGAAGQTQTTTPTTGPVRATVPATVPATQRTAAEANALVRQFFQRAGVTALAATNSSTRVTFNPENGLLLVRGTTNDLRVIEQAIQKVQPAPLAK